MQQGGQAFQDRKEWVIYGLYRNGWMVQVLGSAAPGTTQLLIEVVEVSGPIRQS